MKSPCRSLRSDALAKLALLILQWGLLWLPWDGRWGAIKLLNFTLCVMPAAVIGSAETSDTEPFLLFNVPAEVVFVHVTQVVARGQAMGRSISANSRHNAPVLN